MACRGLAPAALAEEQPARAGIEVLDECGQRDVDHRRVEVDRERAEAHAARASARREREAWRLHRGEDRGVDDGAHAAGLHVVDVAGDRDAVGDR